MKSIIHLLFIGSMLALVTAPSNAASLESVSVTHGIDSGLKMHPVGQWMDANKLEIRFQVALPDFKEVDEKSMHAEIAGTRVTLHYSLSEVRHNADQPIPSCFETKLLSYVFEDMANHSYTIQIVSDTASPVSSLPIVPVANDGQPRRALKLHILGDGNLELDGKPITKNALEKEFRDDITYQLPVWIHPDSSSGQEWLELAIQDQLPFDIAKKSDFSDLMEKYGKH